MTWRTFTIPVINSPSLEFGATVDVYGIACYPSRRIRSQKGDDPADVVRLRDSLQRLHTERYLASSLGFREIGHAGIDDTGGHGIDPNALGSERRCEMFYDGVDSALGGSVGRNIVHGSVSGQR